jgi:hypothetical protein
MADLLRPMMRGIRPGKRDETGRVREIWPDVVGFAAAKRSRVASCREGELVVEVASAALRQHLAIFRREEILKSIRERLPEARLESLKCRVSGGF